MGNKKRFACFILVLITAVTAVILLSCSAKNGKSSESSAASGISDERSIAERMKSLLESEMSSQTMQTTEIITNTLPFQTETATEIITAVETVEITATSEITETSENNAELLYVVTPTGKKYHCPNCRTVKNIKEYLSKEVAEQQGYEPCKICKPQ